MIGKGKAIAHGGNAINYALREGKKDEIVGRNMIESDNPADIIREFEMVNQHNYRCKNKYLRYEIGIAPQDRDKLKPENMSKIARTFAHKMGLQNHQWIACTHKDTKNPHIHLIANRIGADGKVFDTTFVSNRSAHIAEEISREMGLTIANEVTRKDPQQKVYSDPLRQKAKEKLQQIAYAELKSNKTLEGFLYGLERRGVGVEPAKNKQGKTYGIRFSYEGQTFKASDIGREFGFHSLAKNFSSSSEQVGQQQTQTVQSRDAGNYQHSYSGGSPGIVSLLGDLLNPNGRDYAEEDYHNELKRRKKPKKKKGYGRQQ
ncbi:relaxase/mobilization nuclease domain-containing protein [uncultured Alistipes sp.]|jgi:putative mobilization protein|uniref:relaxase/mobilization nuclease domain-containing protein n=1 Tax=uncultured Alistipes sp. TaxID=538949 RepID=UPI0025E2C824|nr:relaxase/mobilization nuclease domain-containing protein [uncultured Alistipes sp.]